MRQTRHLGPDVERPRDRLGRPLVRERYKLRPAREGEVISSLVCGSCGYGMTEREMRLGAVSRPHTSILLVDLVAGGVIKGVSPS